MCGILGAWVDNSEEAVKAIEKLFIAASFRGTHATGIAFVNEENNLTIIKEGLPAKDFLKKYSLIDLFKNLPKIKMIGHTRYITSGDSEHQPISYGNHAVVLNGVISQAPKHEWPKLTPEPYKTDNDTEIFLEYSRENFLENLPGSYAAIELRKMGNGFIIQSVRNGYRPVYKVKAYGGSFWASTNDMLIRSHLKDGELLKTFNNKPEMQQRWPNYENLTCNIE